MSSNICLFPASLASYSADCQHALPYSALQALTAGALVLEQQAALPVAYKTLEERSLLGSNQTRLQELPRPDHRRWCPYLVLKTSDRPLENNFNKTNKPRKVVPEILSISEQCDCPNRGGVTRGTVNGADAQAVQRSCSFPRPCCH